MAKIKAKEIEWEETLTDTVWRGFLGRTECGVIYKAKIWLTAVASGTTGKEKSFRQLPEAKQFCQDQLNSFVQSIAEVQEGE